MKTLTIWPQFAGALRPLTADERATLEENLTLNGCLDPLKVWVRVTEPKELAKLGLGMCKQEGCKFCRKIVPASLWEVGDGRWECPECGYGIAPWESETIVVDGHNRYEMCQRLGIRFETCEVDFDNEAEAIQWIVDNQRGRRNDNTLSKIEGVLMLEPELAKKGKETQGKRTDLLPNLAKGPEVNRREQMAKAAGVSHGTFAAGKFVLEHGGEELKADVLANRKSVSAAAKELREIIPPKPRAKSVPRDHFTLEQWEALHPDARLAAVEIQPEWKAAFNYQEGDSIEWARWSWNPVTGCLHGCDYCYARDIAERYYSQKFAPAFLPSQLVAPVQTKPRVLAADASAVDVLGHRNVFTCSMADLFGKWVPREWIEAVLAQVAANPQWTFLFLSKFPQRMQQFEFPDNAWVGASVDKQAAVARAERAFEKVRARVRWLSCEPMMERLTFNTLGMFHWVVIGGASPSSQTPRFLPPFEWIEHLLAQARQAEAKVYFKTNLLGDRIREYPAP